MKLIFNNVEFSKDFFVGNLFGVKQSLKFFNSLFDLPLSCSFDINFEADISTKKLLFLWIKFLQELLLVLEGIFLKFLCFRSKGIKLDKDSLSIRRTIQVDANSVFGQLLILIENVSDFLVFHCFKY